MAIMPVLFISHGAPTLLLDDSPTHDFLQGLTQTLPRPAAIVCISAHWETASPRVSGAIQLETIYDFYGFPPALYEFTYAAPGAPELAGKLAALVQALGLHVTIDHARGLDHGAWVPLALMYPQADIPVIQLSIVSGADAQAHYRLGQALQPLRQAGVLIMGSGSMTHNLREFRGQAREIPPADYVQRFDAWMEQALLQGKHTELLHYDSQAPDAKRAHPSPDHIMPLFVALGAAGEPLHAKKIHHHFAYGILSMAAYQFD